MKDLPRLRVAVVGHTNTGKTSLLRTLMRDVNFGEVSDRPATTRHVEGVTLMVHGQPLMELYDTPGLEDSIALLDHLEAMRGDRRADGVELIDRFLAAPESSESSGRFSQEAKALRQVLNSDVALYVIDARDRVLGKHRDELSILALCAKPVVPVLNFTASPEAQTALWREHLSRVNMHAVAEFDTVVLDEHSERRLLEKMGTLLDSRRATFDALIEERIQHRSQMIKASADLIADLVIDVASYVISVPAQERMQVNAAIEDLKQRVRGREQLCVDRLLELFRFRKEDFAAADLPIDEGKWGMDLFNPAALKQFGVRTGSAAVAGGMVGLTIDAMVGGVSLGAGFAIGSAIGAVLGAGQAHARRLIDQVRGRSELRCDDNTLRLLMMRQATLVQALLRRGHASMKPIERGSADNVQIRAIRKLPSAVDEARIRPHWSKLSPQTDPMSLTSAGRRSAQEQIASQIEGMLGQPEKR